MKKLALILTLAFTMTLLAGCGDDDVYRQPGAGTTLRPEGEVSSAPSLSDDAGSYSADADGDVSDTTDGIMEEGMEGLESGIDQGMDDIGDGLNEAGDRVKDMANGDESDSNNNSNNNSGNNGDSEGMENRNDEGDSHGSVNGNSR